MNQYEAMTDTALKVAIAQLDVREHKARRKLHFVHTARVAAAQEQQRREGKR